ncbi:MAG: DUF63 family protein [Candidatus Aenigmarchaeota archaeon]|nr:DUF63 family protein [Candidatus Aenigmarchaeota archaeon]
MLEEFINENFLIPLCHYYTPVGTISYGLIMVLAVIGTYKLLKYLKIKIDKKFFIGLITFIVYGGWTRALRDHKLGIYQSNIFCSPPIYFFIFFIALASLLLGISIEKITKKKKRKISYEKIMFVIGLCFLLYNATLTNIKNFFAFSSILLLVGFWSLVFLGIHKIKPKLLSLQNAGIIVSHLLDASSTFITLSFFGYCEQHILPGVLTGAYCDAKSLPNYLILPFNPWVMFPLKIIVVWIVLALIDRSKEDIFLKRFLKIVILILGLALGIRDFLTVSML